jgi:PEGA domain-containing protein
MRPRNAILILFLLCAALASAQFAKKVAGSSAPNAPLSGSEVAYGPDGSILLQDEAGNYSVEFGVAHPSGMGWDSGLLILSHDRIRYQVTHPPGMVNKGFDYPRTAATVIKLWTVFGLPNNAAEYKFNDGSTWHFYNVGANAAAAGSKVNLRQTMPYQALIDAGNNPDALIQRLAAMAGGGQRAQRTGEPDKNASMDPAMALYLAGAQTQEDGIIGLWAGNSNNMAWQSAIVKNPNKDRDGYDYIGVLVQPWPMYFQKGEAHLYLKKTTTPGSYTGIEKWRNELGWSWAPAKIVMADPSNFFQTNQVTFTSALGTNWRLTREAVSTATGASPARSGSIRLVTQPGSAQVYLDDKFKGSSSEREGVLVVDDLKPGDYRLRVSLSGYKEQGQTVTVTSDKVSTITVSLAAEGPKPLGKDEVQDLLKNGVPKSRIMGMIGQYGVDFDLSGDVEQQLRAVGADSDLLLVIARNKK